MPRRTSRRTQYRWRGRTLIAVLATTAALVGFEQAALPAPAGAVMSVDDPCTFACGEPDDGAGATDGPNGGGYEGPSYEAEDEWTEDEELLEAGAEEVGEQSSSKEEDQAAEENKVAAEEAVEIKTLEEQRMQERAAAEEKTASDLEYNCETIRDAMRNQTYVPGDIANNARFDQTTEDYLGCLAGWTKLRLDAVTHECESIRAEAMRAGNAGDESLLVSKLEGFVLCVAREGRERKELGRLEPKAHRASKSQPRRTPKRRRPARAKARG